MYSEPLVKAGIPACIVNIRTNQRCGRNEKLAAACSTKGVHQVESLSSSSEVLFPNTLTEFCSFPFLRFDPAIMSL